MPVAGLAAAAYDGEQRYESATLLRSPFDFVGKNWPIRPVDHRMDATSSAIAAAFQTIPRSASGLTLPL
jgi:hypothetical protein